MATSSRLGLFEDREFYRKLGVLALPIFIQSFIQTGLGVLDVFMVGQLNDTSVAAIGLANQVFFLIMLFLFGVSSGAAIFTAQAWGKQDLQQIDQVIGFGVILGLIAASIFFTAAFFFPERILSIYTEDQAVIDLGAQYLRIVAISYFASALTFVTSGVLRSIEIVTMPMVISLIALGLNSVFNFALIFGRFGFPQLGVPGAAYATAGARILETILLISLVYYRRLPIAKPIGDYFKLQWDFAKKFLTTTAPVVGTEIAWSLGITTYTAIYARIGTESVAAIQISETIQQLSFVAFISIGSAASIMIGNRIGANEADRAQIYAGRLLVIQVSIALLLGFGILALNDLVPNFYNVSAEASANISKILLIMGAFLTIRATNLMLFIGILRAGGDTWVGFLLDVGPLWLIGVPLAWVAAFVWDWPIEFVYMLTMSEEIIKMILALMRYRSGKWIHILS